MTVMMTMMMMMKVTVKVTMMMVRAMMKMKVTVMVTEMVIMVRVTVLIMKQQNTVSILYGYPLVCVRVMFWSANKGTKSALISNSNSKYYASPPLYYPLISSPFISLLRCFFSPLSSALPPSYHLCSSSHLISSLLISLFPPLLLYAVSNFFSSADIFELKLLAAFNQPMMITPRMPPR